MRVATGRAAVSFGPGRMELREYPVLPPEPDQALIRVSMATICGSDLHAWRGEMATVSGTDAPRRPAGATPRRRPRPAQRAGLRPRRRPHPAPPGRRRFRATR